MKELRAKEEWNTAFNRGESKIVWEVQGNPKRSGFKAHARFEQYFGAETVAEYLDKGGTKGDLRYDWENKFLMIEAPQDVPPVAEAEATKSEKQVEPAKKTSRKASKEVVDDQLLS